MHERFLFAHDACISWPAGANMSFTPARYIYRPLLKDQVGEKGNRSDAGAKIVGEGQKESAKILWMFKSVTRAF